MPSVPTITPPVTLAMCPVTIKSILYSPVFTLEGDGEAGTWQGDITFNVAAIDMAVFCSWAMGNVYNVIVGGTSAVRIIPLSHPLFPNLLARGIKGATTGSYTVGNPDSLKNWSDAKVTITFKSVVYALTGQTPYLIRRARVSAEDYSLAGRQLFFVGNGQPLQADASIRVPTTAYSVTVFQVPTVDDVTISGYAGTINTSTFLGFPVGSIRFDTYEYEEQQLMLGLSGAGLSSSQTQFTVTYNFTWRGQHWNKFLRPDCVWDTVAIGSSGGTAFGYTLTDLNDLLK